MGSAQSVPPAFELRVVDGRQLLSLSAPKPASPTADRDNDDRDNDRDNGLWMGLERLLLDAGPRPAGPVAAAAGANALRNRRTRLRGATVQISLGQLNRALAAAPLGDAGIVDARAWMAPGGPRLTGTFVAGNHRTPFTIRPAIEPRASGPRRVRVVLSDVRAYAAAPLPASLIGVALARAISAGSAEAGPALRGLGPTLDLDLLVMALEHSLVACGWRLPDLTTGWLESIDAGGGGTLRLRFGGDGSPTDRFATLAGGRLPVVPRVEGEPLPESALDAEERLNAGDLIAAEAAFRAAVRESPRARPLQARLLALRCAAGGADVADMAAAMVRQWPDFVPGWLGVALAARAAGDLDRAAKAFGRVAALCEARDERQDGTLARAAEAEARAAAEHIRHALGPRTSVTEAAEITQQDGAPVEGASIPGSPAEATEAAETTQQDPTDGDPVAITDEGERGSASDAGAANVDVDAGSGPPSPEPAPAPRAPGLTDQTEAAILRGDLAEADALFARRLEAARDAPGIAALTAERARVQLMVAGGAARALTTLRSVEPSTMTEEGLVLRADLSERVGDVADAGAMLAELMARAVAAGDHGQERQLAARQAELAGLTPPGAGEPKESSGSIRAENPGTGAPEQAVDSVTGKTVAVYDTEDDADRRAQTLGQLMEEFEALDPARQHAAYASFGRVAESAGDLEHAEEAYWRAARLAGDPERRAGDLLAHARVLISRGNVAAANTDLTEALALVPDHAGALALAAEQAFQAHDWQRAWQFYARLDEAPASAEVIGRETLVFRQAVSARAAGELTEAEARYRELALLDPHHVGAHQALAEIAIARDDPRTAADHWEEVLRLLPLDALGGLLDVRQRLADLYARLEEWGSARYYAELVLAQDPGRVAMLERVAEIDERLGLFPAAVEVLGRLARQYSQPRKRAEALFRQGEILLERMNEPGRAFEAHLKASDLDPSFVPTALRLIEGYWRAGDLAEAAGVGEELRRAGSLPDITPLLRIRWTLAAALAWRDPTRALEATQLGSLPWNADLAATGLTEASAILTKRPPHELEPAIAAIDAWSSQDAANRETHAGTDGLRAAVRATVMDDPAAPGLARAFGCLADRHGDFLSARAWFGAAIFLDRGDGATARLDELGRAPAPTETGLALAGPAEHPDAAGNATPLRRALAALAHGLVGFTSDGSDSGLSSGGVVGHAMAAESSGSILAVDVQDALATLARSMDSPPTVMVPVREPVAAAANTPAARVRVVGGRPHRLEIPSSLLGIPRDELTFLVALALDRARSGLTMIGLATDGSAAAVGSVLQGAAAALGAGDDAVDPQTAGDELALRVANALATPDSRTALQQTPGGIAASLERDLERSKDVLGMWDTFRSGAERASDRFAALACRNPLAALRALYRADAVTAPGAAELSERERRQSFLRTSRVRDLLRFLSSPEYARSVGVTSGDDAG